MNTRSLAALAVIAVLLIGSGLVLSARRMAQHASMAPDVLYPNLIDKLDQIAHVQMRGANGELNFERTERGWTLLEKGGHPIRLDDLRAALIAVSDLRVLEPKTSKPENYPLLGVEDPGPDSDSVLVRVDDDAGRTLVSIVLGKMERSATTGVVRRYVRTTDNPRVYYVAGAANVSTHWTSWINREILRLTRSRIHDVVLTHPDGDSVRVYRPTPNEDNFSPDLPDVYTSQPDPLAANMIGNIFIILIAEDIARDIDPDAPDATPGPVARVRMFNGLTLTVSLFDYENATWARFKATAGEPIPHPADDADADTPEDLQAEADAINQRLGGWRYRLNEEKIRQISTRTTDMFSDI